MYIDFYIYNNVKFYHEQNGTNKDWKLALCKTHYRAMLWYRVTSLSIFISAESTDDTESERLEHSWGPFGHNAIGFSGLEEKLWDRMAINSVTAPRVALISQANQLILPTGATVQQIRFY